MGNMWTPPGFKLKTSLKVGFLTKYGYCYAKQLTSGTMGMRKDLQGLRALAIFAVLFFHLWPSYFKAGFLGVDV